MPPRVFHRLLEGVLEMDDYFRQRQDAYGNPGVSTLQKVTPSLRMYSYGVAADATNEYVRL
ncbi:hypothetical protein DVH05_006045 [Phytophthora capsici]|nr:hypothetical protein DVH05_006045 [Phytophthora capsici]